MFDMPSLFWRHMTQQGANEKWTSNADEACTAHADAMRRGKGGYSRAGSTISTSQVSLHGSVFPRGIQNKILIFAFNTR
jgi:hypothetical protein